MGLARSSDNETASRSSARKGSSSSLSKISPFPRAYKLAAYTTLDPSDRGGGSTAAHRKDVRARPVTRGSRSEKQRKLSRPRARPGHSVPRVHKVGQQRKKNGTNRCGEEEQPGLCRESGIDYKKETGYRIKAIPAAARTIPNSSQAHNFYPEASLRRDMFGSNSIISDSRYTPCKRSHAHAREK